MMVTISELPVEIIEYILRSKRLSIKDVINFSLTCRYFRQLVIQCNVLWKLKLNDRWPKIDEYLKNPESYYDEVCYLGKLRKRCDEYLEKMPPRFYKKYELSESDMVEWLNILPEKPYVYYYLVTYLINIINMPTEINSIEVVDLHTPGNMTLKYYASKVLRYIKQVYLSVTWKEFSNLPPQEQILEKAAVIVAQWSQPNKEICWESVASQLDGIANLVKNHLENVHPKHRLLQASPQEIAKWRVTNLSKNQWNEVECRQIIQSMKEVLYKDLGFKGNNIAYYLPENSFINEVLARRTGLPITLAIVYEAIGRRLGLRFDPINSPEHFLVRFIESEDPDSDWYYIDVFNDGNVIRANACPKFRGRNPSRKPTTPPATATQVVERMAGNLEVSARQHTDPNGRVTRLRSALELLKIVNPHDISALVSLARLYMLHNMDTKPLETFLMEQEYDTPEQAYRVIHMLRDYDAHHQKQVQELFRNEAVPRPLHLKYAVGMVMVHLVLNYHCVIYDWDPVCLASPEWQRQMNVAQLPHADQQPFYNVLAEDGSHRYVAQENLKPTNNQLVISQLLQIEDIGRYFSHFYYNHFIPNLEKEKEYPGDRKVRHNFYYQEQLKNVMLV